jgi:hypothetical protein
MPYGNNHATYLLDNYCTILIFCYPLEGIFLASYTEPETAKCASIAGIPDNDKNQECRTPPGRWPLDVFQLQRSVYFKYLES